jgi:hypothetical protein
MHKMKDREVRKTLRHLLLLREFYGERFTKLPFEKVLLLDFLLSSFSCTFISLSLQFARYSLLFLYLCVASKKITSDVNVISTMRTY